MEIKGAAVRTIPEFIRLQYPDRYQEWYAALPASSAMIFNGGVKTSDWYPLMEAMVIPTQILGRVAFNGDIGKAAWECGRYSAESTLKGIYRFFLMAAPSKMIITSGSRILATFYKPVQFKVVDADSGQARMHITLFGETSEVIENRIAGWIEKALEIQGMDAAKVEITRSLARGDSITEILIIWK